MCSHKARSHLDSGSSQIQESLDVRAGIDAARGNDRHGAAVLVLKGLNRIHHLGHQHLQGMGGILNLFGFEAQMAASLGAFHHKGVRQVIETGKPFFGNDGGGSGRGNNGDELSLELLLLFLAKLQQMARHFQRQTRAGENDVRLVFNGRAHHLAEGGQGHHDVDADDAVGKFTGLDNFIAQSAQIGFQRVFGHVRFFHADHGSGNNADAALIGDRRRKAGKRDTHAHAALDNGHFSREIADLQRREGHYDKTSVLNQCGVTAADPPGRHGTVIPNHLAESIAGKVTRRNKMRRKAAFFLCRVGQCRSIRSTAKCSDLLTITGKAVFNSGFFTKMCHLHRFT